MTTNKTLCGALALVLPVAPLVAVGCTGDDAGGSASDGAGTVGATAADDDPTTAPGDDGETSNAPDDGGSADGTTAADDGATQGATDGPTDGGSDTTGGPPIELDDFSFFVTSLAGLQMLSGSDMGFGGNLSYDGQVGIAGADHICETLAEESMPGSSAKGWRAYLSTTTQDAIDRVGSGPWYDRNGRLIASDLAALMMERPDGDAAAVADLPNEFGVPNSMDLDNHDTMTGTTADGRLATMTNGGPGGGGTVSTCMDWTSVAPGQDPPMMGHSWPAQSGQSWVAVGRHGSGCEPLVYLEQTGGNCNGQNGVGCGGGYGGFYCFALTP